MVDKTNQTIGQKQFKGQYFSTTAEASPLEAWLAQSLDILAEAETRQGWQHPLLSTGSPLTRFLTRMSLLKRRSGQCKPRHITPSSEWEAGYFVAYHVYPYYPDSLRYQKDYLIT